MEKGETLGERVVLTWLVSWTVKDNLGNNAPIYMQQGAKAAQK
jgi:hypothetical protein